MDEVFGKRLNVWLNVVSGGSSLLVICMVLVAMILDGKLMDRVSIRFSLGVAVLDLIKACLIIVYAGWHEEGPKCTFLSFSIQWATLVYVFLNTAIAVNLQLVFVHGIQFCPEWEQVYWYTSLAGASAIASGPLFGGRLGLDDFSESCDYRFPEENSTYVWQWCSFFVWIFAACLYCSIVVAFTIWRLRAKRCIVDKVVLDPSTDPVKLVRLRQDIRRLIRRVAFYCVIPVVTQLGNPLNIIYFYHRRRQSDLLVIFSLVGSGFLNLIAFLLDPAFATAIFQLKETTKLKIKTSLAKFHTKPTDSDTPIATSHHRPVPFSTPSTRPLSSVSQLMWDSDPWPESNLATSIYPEAIKSVRAL